MADLRQFQAIDSGDGGSFQVPQRVAPTSPTMLDAIGNTVLGLAGPLVQASESAAQARIEEAAAAEIGAFTGRLSAAQEASQTDPKFNLAREQRKLFQEAVAANPSMAEDLIKVFKSTTGIDPAGMSDAAQARQKIQEEAWQNGFGSPDASPEVNEKQLDLYMDIQRESKILAADAQRMNAEEQRQRISDAARKRQVLKGTQKLSNLEFESTVTDMNADLQALQSGQKTLAEVQQDWAMSKVRLGIQLNQMGDLVNDPDVQAMLKPIYDLYDLAEKNFTGEFDLAAMQRSVEIAQARADAQIISDPETALAISTSRFFGHQPGMVVQVSDITSKILAEGPKDLRTANPTEAMTVQQTLTNMAADPEAIEEAKGIVLDTLMHAERNVADYTQDELLKVAAIMEQPEIYSKMTPAQRRTVQEAFQTFAVDVADNVWRDIQANTDLTRMTFGTGGGTSIGGRTAETLTIDQYAELVVDNLGMRYEVMPEMRNERQVRNKVMSLNKQLDQINPILNTLTTVSGMGAEQVAQDFFGIGGEEATEAPESDSGTVVVEPRPLTQSDQVNPTEAATATIWEDTPRTVANLKEQGFTLEQAIDNIRQWGFANEEALINQIRAGWEA